MPAILVDLTSKFGQFVRKEKGITNTSGYFLLTKEEAGHLLAKANANNESPVAPRPTQAASGSVVGDDTR